MWATFICMSRFEAGFNINPCRATPELYALLRDTLPRRAVDAVEGYSQDFGPLLDPLASARHHPPQEFTWDTYRNSRAVRLPGIPSCIAPFWKTVVEHFCKIAVLYQCGLDSAGAGPALPKN